MYVNEIKNKPKPNKIQNQIVQQQKKHNNNKIYLEKGYISRPKGRRNRYL